jgi:hypothetical protein
MQRCRSTETTAKLNTTLERNPDHSTLTARPNQPRTRPAGPAQCLPIFSISPISAMLLSESTGSEIISSMRRRMISEIS